MSYISSLSVSKNPPPVFVCTDICADIDDCSAVRTLTSAHKQGRIRLIGFEVNANNTTNDSVAALDALLTWDGFPNSLIGYTAGPSSASNYTATLIAYPHTQTKYTVPSGVTAMRTALAAQANGSVQFVSIGYLTGISALLQSPADSISPLTGLQLVSQKVRRFFLMAGKYPTDLTFAEFNIQGDETSAAYVYANWPTTVPITLLGYEIASYLGALTVDLAATDPLKAALTAYGGADNAWDTHMALIASYGSAEALGWGLVRGTCTVNTTTHPGSTVFTDGPGNFEYVVVAQQNAQLYASVASSATSLSVTAPFFNGPYLLDPTGTSETVNVIGCSGTQQPFTVTLSAGLANSHNSGITLTGLDQSWKTALINQTNDGLQPGAKAVWDSSSWTPALAKKAPAVWLKASDLYPGISVGGSVATWNDRSGNGNNFSQSVSAHQPTLVKVNGLYCVSLNGNTGGQYIDLNPYANINYCTVFVVASNNQGSGNYRYLLCQPPSMSVHESPYASWSIIRQNDDGLGDKSGNGSAARVNVPLDGWAGVHIYECCNGDQYSHRRNGQPMATNYQALNAGAGVGIRLGADGGGNENWGGNVYEVIIFDYICTSTERQLVRAYLNSQYGAA